MRAEAGEAAHLTKGQAHGAFPPPTGPHALPASGWRWNDASKNKFLRVAAQASSADGKPYRLQVAMDLTDSEEVLDDHRFKVDALLLLGGLFSCRRSSAPPSRPLPQPNLELVASRDQAHRHSHVAIRIDRSRPAR